MPQSMDAFGEEKLAKLAEKLANATKLLEQAPGNHLPETSRETIEQLTKVLREQTPKMMEGARTARGALEAAQAKAGAKAKEARKALKQAPARKAKAEAAKKSLHARAKALKNGDGVKRKEFHLDPSLPDRRGRNLLEFLFGAEPKPVELQRSFQDWALASVVVTPTDSIALGSLRMSPAESPEPPEPEVEPIASDTESERPESWSAWLARSNLSVSLPASDPPDAQQRRAPIDRDKGSAQEGDRFWRDVFDR